MFWSPVDNILEENFLFISSSITKENRFVYFGINNPSFLQAATWQGAVPQHAISVMILKAGITVYWSSDSAGTVM